MFVNSGSQCSRSFAMDNSNLLQMGNISVIQIFI